MALFWGVPPLAPVSQTLMTLGAGLVAGASTIHLLKKIYLSTPGTWVRTHVVNAAKSAYRWISRNIFGYEPRPTDAAPLLRQNNHIQAENLNMSDGDEIEAHPPGGTPKPGSGDDSFTEVLNEVLLDNEQFKRMPSEEGMNRISSHEKPKPLLPPPLPVSAPVPISAAKKSGDDHNVPLSSHFSQDNYRYKPVYKSSRSQSSSIDESSRSQSSSIDESPRSQPSSIGKSPIRVSSSAFQAAYLLFSTRSPNSQYCHDELLANPGTSPSSFQESPRPGFGSSG